MENVPEEEHAVEMAEEAALLDEYRQHGRGSLTEKDLDEKYGPM